jgi:hypothetical protein
MTVKKPGMWEPWEDTVVLSGVRSKRAPADVAKSLNRLERSVLIRAQVLGRPFT